jgi:hypothetical protein
MIDPRRPARLCVETVADAPEVLGLVEELEDAGLSAQLGGSEGSWAIDIGQRAAEPTKLLRMAIPIVGRWLGGKALVSVRLVAGDRVYDIDLRRPAGSGIA